MDESGTSSQQQIWPPLIFIYLLFFCSWNVYSLKYINRRERKMHIREARAHDARTSSRRSDEIHFWWSITSRIISRLSSESAAPEKWPKWNIRIQASATMGVPYISRAGGKKQRRNAQHDKCPAFSCSKCERFISVGHPFSIFPKKCFVMSRAQCSELLFKDCAPQIVWLAEFVVFPSRRWWCVRGLSSHTARTHHRPTMAAGAI